LNARIDWDAIDLVVFDVDGTLYDARRLRRAMALRLLADAWHSRSLHTLRVLRAFREVREALAMEDDAEFLHLQYQRTAQRAGCEPADVRALVHEWMERRPLPLLRTCRREAVDRLFKGLRAAGKRVAVLSDYPAHEKLRALQLQAQWVASAHDPGIGRLKPDPRGLHALMLRAGATPRRTLMVGDRADRDALVARRAGAQCLLLGRPGIGEGGDAWPLRFRRFDEPVFAPVLAPAAG
jgi:phosphoglycolate phosphatase/putative hydrolase of the HAD superfamily